MTDMDALVIAYSATLALSLAIWTGLFWIFGWPLMLITAVLVVGMVVHAVRKGAAE